VSIHSDLARNLWDDIISHKGMRDQTKDLIDANSLNFNDTLQQLEIQKMRSGYTGEIKLDS
jgi:hypothetical protein